VIVTADVLDWAREYDGPPFHAVLCDPPYELAFMGKPWDAAGVAFLPDTWAAIASHVHPGGFVMACGGSRTYHRLACAMEDAGLIVHPAIGWMFGSGFPKATRIDTQIDKAAGAEREVVGQSDSGLHRGSGTTVSFGVGCDPRGHDITAPATPLAAVWAGHRYGLQALKPAFEFIAVAQVPYRGKPVESITTTGAGALWIDGGRVATMAPRTTMGVGTRQGVIYGHIRDECQEFNPHPAGRWPPNLALCHTPDCRRVGERRVRSHNSDNADTDTARQGPSCYGEFAGRVNGGYADPDGLETVAAYACSPDCPVAMIGEQSGESRSVKASAKSRSNGVLKYGGQNGRPSHGTYTRETTDEGHADHGTAARFFPNPDWTLDVAERIANADPALYCAKASRRERNAGLDGMPERDDLSGGGGTEHAKADAYQARKSPRRNPHPTVKPLALCRWLATLLLPPDAYAPRRILVPFAGSGSEAIGAMLAGWEDVTAVEREPEYVAIAEARMAWWEANRDKAPEVRAIASPDNPPKGTQSTCYGHWASDRPSGTARHNGNKPEQLELDL
jgi:hypothetical protein